MWCKPCIPFFILRKKIHTRKDFFPQPSSFCILLVWFSIQTYRQDARVVAGLAGAGGNTNVSDDGTRPDPI